MASTLSGQGKRSRGVIHLEMVGSKVGGRLVGMAACGSSSIRTVTDRSIVTCKRCLSPEKVVNISPDAPPGYEVYATRKNVFGYGVLEINSDFYVSLDMKIEASRFYRSSGAAFSGWVVSSRGGRSYSDPLPNKKAALEVMASWERNS